MYVLAHRRKQDSGRAYSPWLARCSSGQKGSSRLLLLLLLLLMQKATGSSTPSPPYPTLSNSSGITQSTVSVQHNYQQCVSYSTFHSTHPCSDPPAQPSTPAKLGASPGWIHYLDHTQYL